MMYARTISTATARLNFFILSKFPSLTFKTSTNRATANIMPMTPNATCTIITPWTNIQFLLLSGGIDCSLSLNIYCRESALLGFIICFGPKCQLVSYVKGVVIRSVDVLTCGKQQVVIVGKVYDGPHRVPLAFIDVGLA